MLDPCYLSQNHVHVNLTKDDKLTTFIFVRFLSLIGHQHAVILHTELKLHAFHFHASLLGSHSHS